MAVSRGGGKGKGVGTGKGCGRGGGGHQIQKTQTAKAGLRPRLGVGTAGKGGNIVTHATPACGSSKKSSATARKPPIRIRNQHPNPRRTPRHHPNLPSRGPSNETSTAGMPDPPRPPPPLPERDAPASSSAFFCLIILPRCRTSFVSKRQRSRGPKH